MLRRIAEYNAVLTSYSRQVLPLVDWRTTRRHNVEVLNDTGDYYCFFDATAHAEFLYQCVEETVTRDLPQEVAYLEGYDEFSRRVQEEIADMPERVITLLVQFLRQNIRCAVQESVYPRVQAPFTRRGRASGGAVQAVLCQGSGRSGRIVALKRLLARPLLQHLRPPLTGRRYEPDTCRFREQATPAIWRFLPPRHRTQP